MALQDYQRSQWVDGTTPAINSTNLLNIENGIDRATTAIQQIENTPYVLPAATEANLGGVMVKVIDNGDGSFTGQIWV